LPAIIELLRADGTQLVGVDELERVPEAATYPGVDAR
jgi:hypothetical protein